MWQTLFNRGQLEVEGSVHQVHNDDQQSVTVPCVAEV